MVSTPGWKNSALSVAGILPSQLVSFLRRFGNESADGDIDAALLLPAGRAVRARDVAAAIRAAHRLNHVHLAHRSLTGASKEGSRL